MTELVPWLVFAHIVGAFVFAAGHGVSVVVAFRLRAERDPVRIASLLDTSGTSLAVAGIGLLVLLVSGIAAGIALGSFGRLWIWASLVVLILVGGLMTPLGATWFNQIRQAVGQRPGRAKPDDPEPLPASPDELAVLLQSRRPELLLLLGGIGFVVILWLMRFRPF